MSITTLELRSLATPDGQLRLTLEDVLVTDPGPDEVIIRVDAAPINPSDLGTLLGPADLTTLSSSQSSGRPTVTAKIPPQAAAIVAARVGKSLAMGNEGAGEVIAAGDNATHLLGKVVSVVGGAMFTRYRKVRVADVLPLPKGVTAKQGASD